MAKKYVLQRNLQRGGGGGRSPIFKYLLVAAVCLAVLVLIADYIFKPKETAQKLLPQKGAITKELPKQAEQSAPDRLREPANPAEPVRPSETKPPEPAPALEAAKPPEVQPAPQAQEPSPAAPQKPPVEEAPSQNKATVAEKAPPAQPAEPAPKDLFPKKGGPSQAPATAAQKGPAKSEAKAGGQIPATKPSPTPVEKPAPSAAQKGDYAIQVGEAFLDKSKAEAVRKDLANKGYSATVRALARGSGYIVTTGPVPQSKAYTLLEQMKIQGLSNTKVIKVASTPKPAPKPALQGQPAPEN